MNNQTTAARMGRSAGIAYRYGREAFLMIDWKEVAVIVAMGLTVAVIGTYLAGKGLGRAVHRANDQLARAWVRLWVPGATGKDCLQVADHVLTTGPVVEHETATGDPQAATPSEVLTGANLGDGPIPAYTLVNLPHLPIQPAPIATGRVVTAELARQMMAGGMSQRAVSRELAIPRTTLRRMLAEV
jgi:hypothetical protein